MVDKYYKEKLYDWEVGIFSASYFYPFANNNYTLTYTGKRLEQVWLRIHTIKYLISNSEHICDEWGNIKQEEIIKCENEEIKKHYRLLRADELNKAYLPYMDKEFRWTNDEKCYILSKIDEANKVFYPGEIKMLLNEYRQKSK